MILVGVISSCQDEIVNDNSSAIEGEKIQLSVDEAISIANDNPKNLTEEEVIDIVNGFSNSLGLKTRSGGDVSASILGKYYIGKNDTRSSSSSSESVPVYEVSLTNGSQKGYAIVSADSRSAGILAYVENGDIAKKDSAGAGMMLKLSEAVTLYEINKVERLKSELRGKTLAKIASVLGKTSVTYDDVKDLIKVDGIEGNDVVTRSPSYDKPLTQVVSLVPKTGPVLKTEWSQDEPYNLLLPDCYVPSIFHYETHYPMGCAIAAGVQTLAAIAPSMTIDGTVIDWAFVTKKPKLSYDSYFGGDYEEAMMVSKVVKHMYANTGTYPNFDYDFEYEYGDNTSLPCVKSSTTGSLELKSYLENYVYCGEYYSEYAPDPLLTTLDVNTNRNTPCVAIMGGFHEGTDDKQGGSHCWVIDAYAICLKSSREILRQNDLYFHANMGWGGTNNGYYKVNADTTTDFETELGTYNMNFWEITEIRRK